MDERQWNELKEVWGEDSALVEEQEIRQARERELKEISTFKRCYEDRAKQLGSVKLLWAASTVIISILIAGYVYCYPYLFKHEFDNLALILEKLQVVLDQRALITFYYLNKILGFILLFSLLAWTIKIFNHNRRLHINYRDKVVIADAYLVFIKYDTNSERIQGIEKHALEYLFSNTLDQIEKNKEAMSQEYLVRITENIKYMISKEKIAG